MLVRAPLTVKQAARRLAAEGETLIIFTTEERKMVCNWMSGTFEANTLGCDALEYA